ncbi:hypothetical protein [Lacinutrix sp. Bg11-31]|uniref:hypothetical protein n=1 Tax=Lacinutrix sp. Bg11-31 TaxID=2057808 RepID=UPI000C317CB7|nr:hypothetical protein [Lacinutrix sp. Bg11-31]AUC83138.1 hypothetical protein CW733_13760 [Lacinutrix sp. Bg11-31]
MKNILHTLFLISVFFLHAQKIENKIIESSSIQSITIEGNAIFKIDINTSATKNIKVTSKIEGEYAKSSKVLTQIINDVLLITSDYPELTNKTDDKLNAHKVHSIEISLDIPQHLNLYIKSEIASAKISGTYNYLLLELNQGNAEILNFTGNATINTHNGNITLETNNAVIEAKTKTGILKSEKITESQNQIKITSINGNINIYKTKK